MPVFLCPCVRLCACAVPWFFPLGPQESTRTDRTVYTINSLSFPFPSCPFRCLPLVACPFLFLFLFLNPDAALNYWFNGLDGYDCSTLAAVNGTCMSASNALTFLHLFVKADASNRSNPKYDLFQAFFFRLGLGGRASGRNRRHEYPGVGTSSFLSPKNNDNLAEQVHNLQASASQPCTRPSLSLSLSRSLP